MSVKTRVRGVVGVSLGSMGVLLQKYGTRAR
jgi:hypothetical protein